MSGLTAGAARRLRASAIGLNHASATLARTLEGLCDHDLARSIRVERTDRLHADLAEVRLATRALGEALHGVPRAVRTGQRK